MIGGNYACCTLYQSSCGVTSEYLTIDDYHLDDNIEQDLGLKKLFIEHEYHYEIGDNREFYSDRLLNAIKNHEQKRIRKLLLMKPSRIKSISKLRAIHWEAKMKGEF